VPEGPVVSPTGIVYEEGVPPTDTRFSQTAALYLRSAEPDRALEIALDGIGEDPRNPVHYYLAGIAHARLGAWAEADRMFVEAQRIYPAYELDIEPERLAAWAEAFNTGSEAYADGRDDEALDAWKGATQLYSLRPEAHRNLGMLLTQEGQLDEAIEVYQDLLEGLSRVPATRVLEEEEVRQREEDRIQTEESLADLLLLTDRFVEAEPLLRAKLARNPDDSSVRQDLALTLMGLGKREEAREIYEDLLSERGLQETELYNLGVALFRAGEAVDAAYAFRRLTETRPRSRDAWFNYANALMAAERWSELRDVGETLLSVDPLGETSGLLVARAHLETGDQEGALRHLDRVDATPVFLEGLAIRSSGPTTVLQGRMVGNAASPGQRLNLRFVFMGETGQLVRDTLFRAPAQGEAEAFEFDVEIRATSFRYELDGWDGR